MVRFLLLTFFCGLLTGMHAQPRFQAVIPRQPAIAGESFLVQFVLEEAGRSPLVKPPVFPGMRLVSGPIVYAGNIPGTGGSRSVQNYVYTVVAPDPGTYKIPAVTAIINGKVIKSNGLVVEVVAPADAERLYRRTPETMSSDYILRPGEDPYDKIRRNLFLKVMVDKTKCYTGEPVVATFKLYSRLESRSDIIKNPGFYGFTVVDMINLFNKEVRTEMVNGRPFDVHTIRKVQLYPQQPGEYFIDAMDVKNEVEFSVSAVNKKTEHEIVEGMLDKADKTVGAGKEIFETTIHTNPVRIQVKPVEDNNKQAGFRGAVGDFTVKAFPGKSELSRNEESYLDIVVGGKGNFIQLDIPVIRWPAGIEGFDPIITDSLDKSKAPLSGIRRYRFPFVAAKSGVYALPPIDFTFFNLAEKKFKSVDTDSIRIRVNTTLFQKKTGLVIKQPIKESGKTVWWIYAAAAVFLFAVGAIILYLRKRKQEESKFTPVRDQSALNDPVSQVASLLDAPDNIFYMSLRDAIWNFFSERFGLTGSEMNKTALFHILRSKGFDQKPVNRLSGLLQRCEERIFTSASLSNEKADMLREARELLELFK